MVENNVSLEELSLAGYEEVINDLMAAAKRTSEKDAHILGQHYYFVGAEKLA